MNCRSHLFLIILGIFFNQSSSYASRVAIYGCVHGDLHMNQRVAETVKRHGATHLIANGDFNGGGGPKSTQSGLEQMVSITGISKQNLYIMPGNWDEEAGSKDESEILRAKSYKIFDQLGTRIADRYDKSGIVEIDGKKIQVAHFPQHPIPKKFLPPEQFIFNYFPGQAHQIATMERRKQIPHDVDLNVFGHTHVQASFYDTDYRLSINAGGLTCRKSPDQHRSIAIYDTETNEVEFYDMEEDPAILMKKLPARMSPTTTKKTYDLQDFGICKLPQNRLESFARVYFNDTQKVLDFTSKSEKHKTQNFNLDQLPDPNQLSEFIEAVKPINEAVHNAGIAAKTYEELAEKNFRERNYDQAAYFAGKEVAEYPVAEARGVRFRIKQNSNHTLDHAAFLAEMGLTDDAESLRKGIPQAYSLNHLEIDRDSVVFYKAIKHEQICKIQKSGLDSRFGGIGGATDKLDNETREAYDYAATQDRGRMYFGDLEKGKSYLSKFKEDGPTLLQIRIPLSKTLEHNLSKELDEWYIAGTTIPANWLSVRNGDHDIPVQSFQCEK